MKILVTGATGFIGSHTCVELLNAGYDVIGIDNFSNSSRAVLAKIYAICNKHIVFYEGDVTDESFLNKILQEHDIVAAIHFAGLKAVGESVAKPLEYYKNNLLSTISLCKALHKKGVKKIIFSSSATVYGDPHTVPIKEDFPLSTTNPYGATKLMSENILHDVAFSDENWHICLLRYFNPIGAHESGLLGEAPNGIPNNLMPYIVQVAAGKLQYLNIFGNDYPTVDGTGVRDYIHVVDLAIAHLKALEKTLVNKGVNTYNIGTGKGYSVLEMVQAFETANNISVPYKITARRAGDIAECYADSSKAKIDLGWQAAKSLTDMCKDSWNFWLKTKK
ncbi:MAG TPA: UDP-glucose 4-epimerase GalE [Candidatus Avacidaminococcus intestinavium]|uniref:UDP-glucose 4-epimerase n=1 Tax=Candidatus Avacidaminococcus intestinavium TaxID=2840684 RepID=A0A9D1SLQ9_9FIRM|nr:UDP-glucose 4-epimerase GalE [Candidatus Avacidaminococcus intestinavium]